MRNTLVIIDVQNDFITGVLGTKEATLAVSHIVERIKFHKYNKSRILILQDSHDDSYLTKLEGVKLPIEHCKVGSYGWQLHPMIEKEIDIYDGEIKRYMKNTFGIDPNLYDIEFERDNIIEICGFCTELCVVSNALIFRAMYPDTEIILHSNACAGLTPEKHEQALSVMESCQIDIVR